MPVNKNLGYHEFKSGDGTLIFKVDFSFLIAVEEETGQGPIALYTHFSNGLCKPSYTKSIVCNALATVNGKELTPEEKEKMFETFFRENGAQNIRDFVLLLLSEIMIGSKKKFALKENQLFETVLRSLSTSPSRSLRSLLLFLGLVAAISTVCACASIKWLMPFIA